MSLVVTVSYEPDGSPSLHDRTLELKVGGVGSVVSLLQVMRMQVPFSSYCMYGAGGYVRNLVGVL